MHQQKPVVFRNRQGLRLFGILHTPNGGSVSGLAVILLSPGVKMRVGPECLYRRMTELFVELGLPVLRFDFYGLGDTTGALNADPDTGEPRKGQVIASGGVGFTF